ncbi:MAG: hypothetical protein COS08_08505 [Euryarchaeota archaeon CG01_land_8_20_14_3_00_38_12]|nr:MAG: hypothetical protein COS08_08505 [Euryarchaeota archaeon CG01_land_8_20_14_3_00_38_12]PJB21754.1 MAG: hypothetical protein CO114_03690 [Euryarchaeota archaeon CG_4_9_14_3_um_filter_38_12]
MSLKRILWKNIMDKFCQFTYKLIYFKLIYLICMAEVKITLSGYRCERCGHQWAPKKIGNNPRVCPKCKSPYWDVPKKVKR